MKMFEEFENELQNANSIKELAKIFLANGVKSVSVNDKQVTVDVNEFGLVENIPAGKWEDSESTKWGKIITANHNGVIVRCEISNSEAENFSSRTGFVFQGVNADESK